MNSRIEIYVRKSGDRIMLNLYVPESVRDEFLRGLEVGSFKARQAGVALELSVLPDWITDPEAREAAGSADLHVRVPLDMVNLIRAE